MSNEGTEEEDPQQKRIKDKNENRGKLILTMLTGFSYMCMGAFRGSLTFCMVEISVTLQQSEQNLRPMQLTLSTRWLGFVVGCVSGGMAYDHYDLSSEKQVLTSVAIVAMALASFLIPFCNSLTALSIPLFLLGVTMTFLTSGLNAFILSLWGMKTNTAMHFVYFCRSLGAFTVASLHYVHSQNIINEGKVSTYAKVQDASHRKLGIIFGIISALLAVSASTWICTYRYLPCEYQLLGPMSKRRNVANVFHPKWLALASVSILFFVLAWKELGYPKLITSIETYFKTDIRLSNKILIMYWGAFLLGRFFAVIFTLRYVNQLQMIIICLALELSACIVLIMIAYVDFSFLKFATLFLGFGAAPLTAATLVWFNKHIVVDSKLSAFFLVLTVLGEMIDDLWLSVMLKKYPDNTAYAFLLTPLMFGMVFAIQSAWFHYQESVRKRRVSRPQRLRILFPVIYPKRTPRKKLIDDDQAGANALKEMSSIKSSLSKYNSENIKLLHEMEISFVAEKKKADSPDPST